MDYLWGVDLGGTKTEGVIVKKEGYEVVERLRVKTESEKGYKHILSRINDLIALMKGKTGLEPEIIGFGTPGVLDPETQVMKNCNSTALNGQTLYFDLQKLLGIKVKMANDANCFALAETKKGIVRKVAPGAESILGIIMGTGVGSGLVINGKVLYGCHGIAGEWGHNFLDKSGGECYCGKTGCVETVLSGPALERFFYALSGEKLPLEEIYLLYKNGRDNNYAFQTIERLQKMFAKAVSNVINIIDPEVIIIGGGVGNINELYSEFVKEEIEKYLFNPVLRTKIVRPSLGDSAGVFGAAMLIE